MDQVREAWEAGDVVITRENGTVPDFKTVTSLLDSDVLPVMSTLKSPSTTNVLFLTARDILSK